MPEDKAKWKKVAKMVQKFAAIKHSIKTSFLRLEISRRRESRPIGRCWAEVMPQVIPAPVAEAQVAEVGKT